MKIQFQDNDFPHVRPFSCVLPQGLLVLISIVRIIKGIQAQLMAQALLARALAPALALVLALLLPQGLLVLLLRWELFWQ